MRRKHLVVVGLFVSSVAVGQLLISSEMLPDAPVYAGSPAGQTDSAVAFNGDVGLVAWASTSGVLAARIDESQNLLDVGGIFLGEGGRAPVVASDGIDFLVVWQKEIGSGSGATSDIMAARVSAAGTLLDPTPIVVSNAPGRQVQPAVAFSGGVYFAAWADARSGGTTTEFIIGARIDPDGVVLDPDGLLVCQAPNSRASATVAPMLGEFVVAWSDGRTTNERGIFAARVSPDGVVREPNGVRVTAPVFLSSALSPAIAFNGTSVFVSYVQNSTIFTTRLTADLVPDVAPFKVSADSEGAVEPNIACDASICLIGWTVGESVRGLRILADGTLLETRWSPIYFGSPTPGGARRLGLAWTGANFIATYSDDTRAASEGGREADVHARVVAPTGTPPFVFPAPLRVSVSASKQTRPAVASNGTEQLAVWVDDRRGTDDIYGLRLTPGGDPVDGIPIVVSSAALAQSEPRIAPFGSDFFVVWADKRGGVSRDVYATRISATGAVRDPAGIAVTAASGDQYEPAVACGPTNCVVVWLDQRNGTYRDVYAARVSHAGMLLDLGGVVVEAAADVPKLAPAVVFDGTRFVITWYSSSAPWYSSSSVVDAVFARRMSVDGTFLDPSPITVAKSVYATKMQVVSGSGGTVAVWIDNLRSIRTDLVPAVLTRTMQSTTNYFYTIAAGTDGADILVVWSHQDPTTSPARWSIRARHMSPTGVPVGQDFEIVTLTQDGDPTPTVTAVGPRRWLVGYARHFRGGPLTNDRVAFRSLTPQSDGVACGVGGECMSGHCIDGVCCDSACGGGTTGDCGVCSVAAGASVDGVCKAVTAGHVCRAAASACDAAEVCDGMSLECPLNGPVADGTACDDRDACTQSDRCTAGACVGADRVVCQASDSCHLAGTCNAVTGLCSNPAKNNGSSCDDGNACTRTDTCSSGRCFGSNQVTCTAVDQCHDPGWCIPETGACSAPAKANGTTCSDGSRCTRTDSCQEGVCVGTNPVVCTAQGPCYDAGTCNPALGTCSNPVKAEGASCDDGNGCTQTDTCRSGTCAGSNPVVCVALDDCHTAGQCVTSTGKCTTPARVNGAACDDGNGCTRTDACNAGRCVGSNAVVCTATDACHDPGVCDPAMGTCSNPPAADGTSCNDGNGCTTSDVCRGGACTGENPVACPPPDACHEVGTCAPDSGECSYVARVDGTPCDDGSLCTRQDSCMGGSCVGQPHVVCEAADQCHAPGTCDPSSGVCSNPVQVDGSSCNDGDACTTGDRCVGGSCSAGTPRVCTASDQCHSAGVCDALTGLCSDPPKTDGEACDDSNHCTQTDRCIAGACAGTDEVACVTLDQCHGTGSCDPATGTCSTPPLGDGTACDDGNACTRWDRCIVGACVGEDPVVCEALDDCHEPGDCNFDTGRCSQPAKDDAAPCDDSDACTTSDACFEGRCVGASPRACEPVDDCHGVGECDPVTGGCDAPVLPDGVACDDGNACTVSDSCVAGACMGGTAKDCAPADECHEAGVCDSATGECVQLPLADGTSCDDGDACTRDDSCTEGVCVPVFVVDCRALDGCHADGVCDPLTGTCSSPLREDGTACDDGNGCTSGDVCRAGSCVGANAGVCAEADECEEPVDCVNGACSTRPRPDGVACSTGVCVAGRCVPSPPDAGPVTVPSGGCDCQATGGLGSAFLLLPVFLRLPRRRRTRDG